MFENICLFLQSSSELVSGLLDPASPSALPQKMASDAFQGKVVCTGCRDDILDRYLLKVRRIICFKKILLIALTIINAA